MPTAATRDDRSAFPRLSDDQVERATAFGDIESLDDGTLLFERGQRSVDFFIVLDGRVEIYDDGVCDDDGNPQAIHVHEKHGFTGELDLFSGRKILVHGRLKNDAKQGRVLRVPRHRFARLLSSEPDIGQIVMRAFILRRLGLIDNEQGGVVMVGRRNSSETLKIERFLRRNGYPIKPLHLDDPETEDAARQTLKQWGGTEDDVPLVVCSDEHILKKPDLASLAGCLGLTEEPETDLQYDVTVIGAGPAGLAGAVYAASEGLKTLVIESEAPGGQAGTSSRIENYLGFPTGVSGWELAARAEHQAQKFGATLVVPRLVKHLEPCDAGFGGYKIHLDNGAPVPHTRRHHRLRCHVEKTRPRQLQPVRRQRYPLRRHQRRSGSLQK